MLRAGRFNGWKLLILIFFLFFFFNKKYEMSRFNCLLVIFGRIFVLFTGKYIIRVFVIRYLNFY